MDLKPLISKLEELERFYKDADRVLEERLSEIAYDMAREYIKSEIRRLEDSLLANTIANTIGNIVRSFIKGQQREELKGPQKELQNLRNMVESVSKEVDLHGKSNNKLINIKSKERKLYERIKSAKGKDLYILIKELEEMNPNYRLEY